MKVHLLGIGGSGVSGLARVFSARGDRVSGCDLRESDTTRLLAAEGIEVLVGHDPDHVAGQDLVVYSGAVRGSPELDAARAAGVRVASRAETLAGLIGDSDAIAVAGTHGKTTVTFMLGHILTQAGWDPSVLVGDGSSSRAGASRWLVAEADESDGSLVLHHPGNAILTNLELDHPDHFPDLAAVREVFAIFLAGLPAEGTALICDEDANLRGLRTPARILTYGLATGDRRLPNRLKVPVPGRHNLLNATGAYWMAVELGVPPAVALAALETYPGAHRRLERLGKWRGAQLIDDYGHHPTEVAATLEAARPAGPGRLILVFQPHRYTRFAHFEAAFADSFAGADEVIVTEIYPAGEENPGGLTALTLADQVPGAAFAPDFETARSLLEELVQPGDVVLLMGAGDIRKLGDELAHAS